MCIRDRRRSAALALELQIDDALDAGERIGNVLSDQVQGLSLIHI